MCGIRNIHSEQQVIAEIRDCLSKGGGKNKQKLYVGVYVYMCDRGVKLKTFLRKNVVKLHN